MWLTLVLIVGFTSNGVSEQIVCEPCSCCKNSVCPDNASYKCSNGCIDGYTGDKCQTRCPDNCELCIQYTSNYCAKCKAGFYNAGYGMCNQACEVRCKSCTSYDNCLSCNDGYFNGLINGRWTTDCSLKCPDNCNSCSSHTNCSSCKEGYYIGSSSGQFYGDCTLSCYSNCKACTSYDKCTECNDGFYGNFLTDCSNKCYHQCKKCTSDGVCTECFNGFHGPSCQYNCSLRCKENECNKENGKCISGCELGYDGEWCNNCVDGFTAKNGTCTDCNDKCEDCSEKGLCIKCKDNFGGIACQTACPLTCRSCVSETLCNECIDGYFDETCSSICDKGRFGNKCSSICPANCQNDECFHNNGSCTLGCEDGYKGDSCDCPIHCECDVPGSCTSCESGYYGNNCTMKCADVDEWCAECPIHYKQTNQGCDRCLSGYYPVQNTSYGHSTCKECPNTCLEDQCDGTNGKCLKGCVDNKWGPSCEEDCLPNCQSCSRNNGSECSVCKGDKYLNDCSQTCSDSCNTTDGIVIYEIQSGACRNGCVSLNIYGSHCEKNCSNTCTENICDWLTGECVNGCLYNYWGSRCENACGRNCKDKAGQTKCDESNGNCLAGCTDGYFSEQCDKKCSINCFNTSCDDKGKCLYGCAGEFENDLCLKAKFESVRKSDGDAVAKIGGIVGGAVAMVILFIILAVVLLKRRQQTKRHNKENALIKNAVLFSEVVDESVLQTDLNETGENVLQSDESVAVYTMPIKIEPQKVPTLPHPVTNSSCQNQSVQIKQPDTEYIATHPDKTVIQGDVGEDTPAESSAKLSHDDVMPASAIKPMEDKDNQLHKEYVLELEDPTENDGSNLAELSLKNGTHSKESQVGDASNVIDAVQKGKLSVSKMAEFVDKKTNNCFEEEFKNLPAGLIKPYTESQKQDNLTKNRYRGVFPYDHNRVVLKDGEFDYINASFIDGYKKLKTYIASLGPTYKYMQDMSAFWRMVWQERCGKIVMLTNLLEAGARKCDQYWPEKDCSKLYADINVACITEENYVEFTIRNFNIQKNSEERNVVQIHFTAWLDKGVPDDVISLIEFRQKVNSVKTNLDGPILVHCSAGIGRTGTYIALDILTQEGETEGNVDIYACVRNLREQRVNMVQTAEQYEYLHRAVVYSLTCDSHALDVTDFQRHMTTTGIETLAQQFQKLDHSVEKRSQDEEEAIVKNKALTEKNRIGADIPGDRNRLRLNLNLKPGACDYINAVYVNSYRRVNRYIVAQSPLQNTVVDFLTLVAQEKCSCVVSMEPETTKDSGVYFPADTHSWKRGSLIVRTEKVTSTQSFIHKRLKLSHHGKDPSEDRIVQHFQLTSWVDGKKCPDNAVSFLDFLHHVELKSGGAEAGPILVHCLTGAEKSGLLCVVAILLEKIQCDQQVSVVNTVRQVKSRRQRVIPNQEQYVFCHQCVNEYIQSFHIYSNFASRQ